MTQSAADSPRLISVGNVVVDLVATVDAVPERGGDAIARDPYLATGGSYNVLAAARRQGLESAYGGVLGTGPFADRARESLEGDGIAILLKANELIDTGYDLALVDAGGERTFVTIIGAEAGLTLELLQSIDRRSADLIHVSGYGLLRDPNRSAILSWLGDLSTETLVLFDPGPLVAHIPEEACSEVLARAAWISCNAREAAVLSGVSDAAGAAAIIAARAGGRGVIVRGGADGCLLAEPNAPALEIPGFAVDVLDSNGAGDAHVGAFLAALARGDGAREAARWANACAALAVTRAGPATAPTFDEVSSWLRALSP